MIRKMIFNYIRKINDFSRKKFHIGLMRNFPYRTSTLFAKEHFKLKKDLICAEIGTWEGENALDVLQNLPNIKTLYLIDPWEEYPDYKDHMNKTIVLDKALKKALKRIRKYKNKIKIIRKTSDEAIGDLPNNLDFIYIDGNHKYEYVKRDIENYYKKLRKGGILAGHDISWFPGVAKAFCEFVVKHKLDPIIRHMDWMVIKK